MLLVAAPVGGLRKVDRARAKTLHADSILQRASLVPPVHWTAPRPKKVYAHSKGGMGGAGAEGVNAGKEGKGEGEAALALRSEQSNTNAKSKRSNSLADLWPDEGEGFRPASLASPCQPGLPLPAWPLHA